MESSFQQSHITILALVMQIRYRIYTCEMTSRSNAYTCFGQSRIERKIMDSYTNKETKES